MCLGLFSDGAFDPICPGKVSSQRRHLSTQTKAAMICYTTILRMIPAQPLLRIDNPVSGTPRCAADPRPSRAAAPPPASKQQAVTSLCECRPLQAALATVGRRTIWPAWLPRMPGTSGPARARTELGVRGSVACSLRWSCPWRDFKGRRDTAFPGAPRIGRPAAAHADLHRGC